MKVCCGEKERYKFGSQTHKADFIITIIQAVLQKDYRVLLMIWPHGKCQFIYCQCGYFG